MDYRSIFQISAAGMSMEKLRVEVAALNLANMNASAPAGQPLYAPRKVLAEPLQINFAQWLEGSDWHGAGVERPLQVAQATVTPRLASDPGHPHADSQGMVRYPGVDHASEMITVMTALRAYEANVAVAATARTMVSKALELGGQ